MITTPTTVFPPEAAPSFDSLPVAQLAQFTKEPGWEPPFAQARFAVLRSRALLAEVRVYEKPAPNSAFRFRMGALGWTLTPDASVFTVADARADNLAARVTRLAGEDLQGEYWGASLYLPEAVLRLGLPGARLVSDTLLDCALTYSRGGYVASLFAGEGALRLTQY